MWRLDIKNTDGIKTKKSFLRAVFLQIHTLLPGRKRISINPSSIMLRWAPRSRLFKALQPRALWSLVLQSRPMTPSFSCSRPVRRLTGSFVRIIPDLLPSCLLGFLIFSTQWMPWLPELQHPSALVRQAICSYVDLGCIMASSTIN